MTKNTTVLSQHLSTMLIHGPTAWTEAFFATGTRTNLLQDGYNPKLHMSATSHGSTVVITHYECTVTTDGSDQGVMGQPTTSLSLYREDSHNAMEASCYRVVAWSQGTTKKSLLAIASTNRLDIWEIHVSSEIHAMLKGSMEIDHLQGISWNPCYEVLLAYSKAGVSIINASKPFLLRREVYASTETHQRWSASSWSPCGLHVSIAQARVLHCLGWTDVNSLLFEHPKHDRIHVDATESAHDRVMKAAKGCVGQVAAVARVSSTMCVCTTDTKLILEDTTKSAPSLLLRPPSTHHVEIGETSADSGSGIIDLTSKRISLASTRIPQSLQILNRIEDTASCQPSAQTMPRSRLLILVYETGKWSAVSVLDLPRLTSPDVLVVQGMRAIIGGTMFSHLLFAHFDNSDHLSWKSSLSSELELPPAHVCKGIRLTTNPLFVDVATTKKRERSTFFQAAATLEPQLVNLSRFNAPQCAQPESTVQPVSAWKSASAIASNDTPSCFGSDRRDTSTDRDLLERTLATVTAMQTQLSSRFDHVDKQLQQLTARIEQLEKNGRADVQ